METNKTAPGRVPSARKSRPGRPGSGRTPPSPKFGAGFRGPSSPSISVTGPVSRSSSSSNLNIASSSNKNNNNSNSLPAVLNPGGPIITSLSLTSMHSSSSMNSNTSSSSPSTRGGSNRRSQTPTGGRRARTPNNSSSAKNSSNRPSSASNALGDSLGTHAGLSGNSMSIRSITASSSSLNSVRSSRSSRSDRSSRSAGSSSRPFSASKQQQQQQQQQYQQQQGTSSNKPPSPNSSPKPSSRSHVTLAPITTSLSLSSISSPSSSSITTSTTPKTKQLPEKDHPSSPSQISSSSPPPSSSTSPENLQLPSDPSKWQPASLRSPGAEMRLSKLTPPSVKPNIQADPSSLAARRSGFRLPDIHPHDSDLGPDSPSSFTSVDELDDLLSGVDALKAEIMVDIARSKSDVGKPTSPFTSGLGNSQEAYRSSPLMGDHKISVDTSFHSTKPLSPSAGAFSPKVARKSTGAAGRERRQRTLLMEQAGNRLKKRLAQRPSSERLAQVGILRQPESPSSQPQQTAMSKGEALAFKLQARPARSHLIAQNILKEGRSDLAPGLMQARQALQREQTQRTIERSLKLRPTREALASLTIIREDREAEDAAAEREEAVRSTLENFLNSRPTSEKLESVNIMRGANDVARRAQVAARIADHVISRPERHSLTDLNIIDEGYGDEPDPEPYDAQMTSGHSIAALATLPISVAASMMSGGMAPLGSPRRG